MALTCAQDEYKSPAATLEDASIISLLGVECPGFSVLIDTGADVSVIPGTAGAVLGINVAAAPRRNLILGGHTTVNWPCIYVKIRHADFGTSEIIRASCTDRDSIVLGRDALKGLLLLFDGAKSRFRLRKRWSRDHYFLKRFF